MVSLRDHGGIGRRAALKMRSPQGGEGSIPSGPIPWFGSTHSVTSTYSAHSFAKAKEVGSQGLGRSC